MPRHSLTWRVLHFVVGEWTSIAAIGILCSTSTPPASAGEHVSFAQIAAIPESMWNRSNRPKVEVRRGALNVMRSCRWHDFGRGASADHRTEIGDCRHTSPGRRHPRGR
jgi:hypothetical protein